MLKIIECVPNVSEGRDLRTIEKLANIIRASQNAQLLDVHVDPDHNRSVFTIIGTLEGVKRAVYDMVEEASVAIDLSGHEGVHPRLGAVDVIPFVPVKNATIKECVTAAYALGEDIEKHLHVPVYFYGEAAQDPATRNLADLRARGYNLKKHRTAGCTAIGVREYLIAFNVDLVTSDLNVAKKIATAIREKNGGLPGVRALGLELTTRKCVQVSMNLVDVKKATPALVEAQVRALAKKHKVTIAGTELVGLLPEQVRKAVDLFVTS